MKIYKIIILIVSIKGFAFSKIDEIDTNQNISDTRLIIYKKGANDDSFITPEYENYNLIDSFKGNIR